MGIYVRGKVPYTGGGSGEGTGYETDPTLSIEGMAADAKATGDAITVRYNRETKCIEVMNNNGDWMSSELQIVSELIPTMTNHLSSKGSCVYSEKLSDTYSIWKAFDKNNETFGACLNAANGYIGFQWFYDVYIDNVIVLMVYTHGVDSSHLLNLKLQYYDGTNWIDVDNSSFNETFTGVTDWRDGENDREYNFYVNKTVRGIRFYGEVVNGENTWALFIREMQAYGYKIESNKEFLFNANNNAANFTAYNGNTNEATITPKIPTVTFGEKMKAVFDATNSNLVAGCIISDLVDVTNYSKIVLNHESTSTGTSSWEWAKLFITSEKSSKMTASAKTLIFNAQSSSSGVVELDISAVNGQSYIGIEMCSNSKVVTVNVNEMYLE